MDTYVVKKQTLVDIANQVRAKTGKTESIPVTELANEIGLIVSKEEGYSEALSKRTDLVVTENGEYTPEGDSTGFKSVSVLVGGENKLAQMISRTITEITEKDLQGVTKIADYAFYKCASLQSVVISSNITEIGLFAFSECNITSIFIPSNVEKLEMYAFRSCKNLASLIFADGGKLTKISDSAFATCTKLKSVTIPEGVTLIEERAFSGCSELVTVILPASLTELKTYSFSVSKPISVTIKATTPPKMNTNVFNTGYIRKITVPIGCGDVYKAATNWSDLASYIVEGDI